MKLFNVNFFSDGKRHIWNFNTFSNIKILYKKIPFLEQLLPVLHNNAQMQIAT